MIQELLGGAGLVAERKPNSPSPSPSPPSSSTTTNTSSGNSESQNLRCPRCDSPNTKFCYYNNYNLTQPRHFCKTCRRYWTKGGALRNVPIGGGCRKNKTVNLTAPGKTSGGRFKSISSEIGKSLLGAGGFDHLELSSNSVMWAPPQNSHLLALLRTNYANPNTNLSSNPNPNPNFISKSGAVKEESVLIGSSEAAIATGGLTARSEGVDQLNLPVASMGLGSPFWRSNQNGFLIGEVQNTGIQELYQRLRSSANYYPDHHSPVFLGNVAPNSSSSSPSSTTTILESAPVPASELGYWNPALSWSDLPTTNGAYP
ncbi:hypothetical protein NMG60_11008090 [Bertholletia excelsa]